MVIKMRSIERAQIVKKGDDNTFASWIYFDNFRKVRIKWVEYKAMKEVCSYDYGNIDAQTPDEAGVALLICRNKPGDEFTIATTEPTYLLNDNGKTIEKLV